MLPISKDHLNRFNQALSQSHVPETYHVYYRKCLRYFLVFCRKYPPPDAKSEQIRLFVEKLRSKKQTSQQCARASHAISLYFESKKWKSDLQANPSEIKSPKLASPANLQPKLIKPNDSAAVNRIAAIQEAAVAEPSSLFGVTAGKRYNEWRCLEKSKSNEWDHAILFVTVSQRIYCRPIMISVRFRQCWVTPM